MLELNVDPVGIAFMCVLYMIVGIIAVMCNILSLTIFLSSKEFRKKYLLFIVLDLGELINAFAHIATGLGRFIQFYRGRLELPHTVQDCFFGYPWPVLLILGMQIPTITIVVLSIERISAVVAPHTFKSVFHSPARWLTVLPIPLFIGVSLGLATYSAVIDRGRIFPSGHCGIITSTAVWYSTYHFTFIVIAYLVSFCSSLFVWIKFKDRKNGTQKLFIMLVVIGVSAFLVAIPSFTNILIRYGLLSMTDINYSIWYSLPGFLSIANTIISFTLRPDVRKRFLELFTTSRLAEEHSMTCPPCGPQASRGNEAADTARKSLL